MHEISIRMNVKTGYHKIQNPQTKIYIIVICVCPLCHNRITNIRFEFIFYFLKNMNSNSNILYVFLSKNKTQKNYYNIQAMQL